MAQDIDNDSSFNPSFITGKALERYFELQSLQIEFHKLFNTVEKNDRTIAIVGATFLDTLLEHILIAFFVNDEKAVTDLLRSDQSLGTFSGKIRLAYCLGLIYAPVRDDLNRVRRIRNKFAHNLDISFEDEQIKDWCHNLQWHRIAYVANPPSDATAQELFEVGVNQLICYLNGVVSIARQEKRVIKNFI